MVIKKISPLSWLAEEFAFILSSSSSLSLHVCTRLVILTPSVQIVCQVRFWSNTHGSNALVYSWFVWPRPRFDLEQHWSCSYVPLTCSFATSAIHPCQHGTPVNGPQHHSTASPTRAGATCVTWSRSTQTLPSYVCDVLATACVVDPTIVASLLHTTTFHVSLQSNIPSPSLSPTSSSARRHVSDRLHTNTVVGKPYGQ
jgi:hypothetical protein